MGTRGEVEEKSEEHSRHTGILITTDKAKILYDLGEREYLRIPSLQVIILSHYHPDHFSKEIEELREITIPIVSTEEILSLLPREKVKLNTKAIQLNKVFRVEDLSFKAYRTLHSKKTPSFALRMEDGVSRVLITGDAIWLENMEEAMKDLDLLIADGSFFKRGGMVRRDKETGEIYGHAGIPDFIRWALKYDVRNIIFTHFGTEAIKMGYEELRRRLDDVLLEEAKRQGKSLEPLEYDVLPARDGMEIDTSKLQRVDIEAIEPRVFLRPVAGIILVAPHAELIVKGKKTAIVKTKRYGKYIDMPLYLIQDKKIWGIISYSEPREIDWEEFRELRDKHQITDEEVERWGWKKYKRLWYYPINLLFKYDEPIPIDYETGPQVFISIEEIKGLYGAS